MINDIQGKKMEQVRFSREFYMTLNKGISSVLVAFIAERGSNNGRLKRVNFFSWPFSGPMRELAWNSSCFLRVWSFSFDGFTTLPVNRISPESLP